MEECDHSEIIDESSDAVYSRKKPVCTYINKKRFNNIKKQNEFLLKKSSHDHFLRVESCAMPLLEIIRPSETSTKKNESSGLELLKQESFRSPAKENHCRGNSGLNENPNNQHVIKKDNPNNSYMKDEPCKFSEKDFNSGISCIKNEVTLDVNITGTKLIRKYIKQTASGNYIKDDILEIPDDSSLNGKLFNLSEEKKLCDLITPKEPNYTNYKVKINNFINTRQIFNSKEEQCDNYVKNSSNGSSVNEQPLLTSNDTPMEFKVGNRLVKINTCETNSEETHNQSEINKSLTNSFVIKEENFQTDLKKMKRKLNHRIRVDIKEEPCDIHRKHEGNNRDIPKCSQLLSTASLKNEKCDSLIKLEKCETDELINSSGHSYLKNEPWLPWDSSSTSEKLQNSHLNQEPHNLKIKKKTYEEDLLKGIKNKLELKSVSKKKLANKYISIYKKPQRNETGQIFKCSECEKSFAMRNLLCHHIIYEHNTLKLLKCPICYRRFNKLSGLSNHIRATHKIKNHHICQMCHHSFSRHHYLADHMRSVHKM